MQCRLKSNSTVPEMEFKTLRNILYRVRTKKLTHYLINLTPFRQFYSNFKNFDCHFVLPLQKDHLTLDLLCQRFQKLPSKFFRGESIFLFAPCIQFKKRSRIKCTLLQFYQVHMCLIVIVPMLARRIGAASVVLNETTLWVSGDDISSEFVQITG